MSYKVSRETFEKCYIKTHPNDKKKYSKAQSEWIYLLSEWKLIGKPKKKWSQAFYDEARRLMNYWQDCYQQEIDCYQRQKPCIKDIYQPVSHIPDNHIPHKFKYLSSSISLRTTDEAISTNLLREYLQRHTNNTLKPNITSFNQQNNKILVEISNVLRQEECNEIIDLCSRKNNDSNKKHLKFQRMNRNKYDKSIRKSDRLLILDEKFSNLLSERLLELINIEIIKQHNISCVPLGFGVLNHNNGTNNNYGWKISSINNGMRINRYRSKHKDFFGYHKDAQYCNTPNERSIFTLIIYLNDDFQGGETKFYFHKSDEKHSINGLTMREEIELNGGINNGYNCITIQPKQCHAVLFSQDLLHQGCKLIGNKYSKYILKTDIIVSRKPITIGFAISSLESMDYKRCLNYFIEAQRNELEGIKIKSNALYERSLSIRYSYPKKLISMQNNDEYKSNKDIGLYIEISDIWFIIFAFAHPREIGFCVSLFPEQLYDIYVKWKLNYNSYIGYDAFATDLPFIPKVIKCYGLYTRFEFPNLRFYKDNREACLRVVAIYTLYLMSHRNCSRYFVVEYDSFTQNIIAIPLKKLLSDVFYGRQCNGKYFKIKSMIDDNSFVDQDDTIYRDSNYDAKNDEISMPKISTSLRKIFRNDMLNDNILNQLNYTFGGRNVDDKLFKAYKNVLALGMNLNKCCWNGLDTVKKVITEQENCVINYYENYNKNKLHEEFNEQIDRDYMTIRHGAQFLGGVGINSDRKFYYDSKQFSQQILNDMKEDFVQMRHYYRYKYPYGLHYNGTYFLDEDVKRRILKEIDDETVLNLGSKANSNDENKMDYFKDISNSKLNIHKTRITKGYNDRCRRTYNVKLCNNLIFDFERKNMKIIESNTKNCPVDICQYCLKFNDDEKKEEFINIVMGKEQRYNNIQWTKTKYKAKFQLQRRHIGNMTTSFMKNVMQHSQLEVSFGFKLLLCNVDTIHRYVTIEFTLTNGWDNKPQTGESVENMMRRALKRFYRQYFCSKNDYCKVEMLEQGYIDDEIRNMTDVLNSIKYYVIDIENLINNDGGYDLSYNHAAANCGVCRVSNTTWATCSDYYNFKFGHYSGYSHMDHLHVATVDDMVNDKLFMWVSYNGIAAL